MREAFLLAGERAARRADHSLIAGTAPPRATLRLRKRFVTETSRPGVVVRDFLSTRLSVPPSGRYTWHVNPSGRPLPTREMVHELPPPGRRAVADDATSLLERRADERDRGVRAATRGSS